MTSRSAPDSADTKARVPRPRWQKEVFLALACILFGLLLLPALIYMVGAQLLGAYGGGPHIGSFYGDYFRNLVAGTGRTWFIVLSPYLFLMIMRGIFFRWSNVLPPVAPGDGNSSVEDREAPAARERPSRERREPFIAP